MVRFSRLLITAWVLLVLAALAQRPARAASADDELYLRVVRSTCRVITEKGSGTGWVVDQQRKHVITNHHVAEGTDTVSVLFAEFDADNKLITDPRHYHKTASRLVGTVLRTDSQRDLTLIQLDSLPEHCPALKLAEDNVAGGERVHSVGHPNDRLWVHSSGSVSTVASRKPARLEGGQRVDARRFRAQMPSGPGCSGGPVVNERGELVGVCHAGQKGTDQVSVCLAVSEVKAFLAETAEKSSARPAGTPGATPASERESPIRLRIAGMALVRQKDYPAAIQQFSRALDLDPKDYLAYNERGAAYTWLDKDSEAIRDFTQAIDLNPRFPIAYRNRGAAYSRQGQLQKALEDLNRALSLNPEYARAYKDRGDVYTRLGKTRQAAADYQKARDFQR
jgi:S1-C subfamily serine protease